jgi:competence protein ComEA
VTAPESRAAEVLDRLARGGSGRSPLPGRSRVPVEAEAAGSDESRPLSAGSLQRPDAVHLRRFTAVAVSALAVVGVAVALVDRRPVPIEDRMPTAAESTTLSQANPSVSADGGQAPEDPDPPAAAVIVHVAGAVAQPGVVELPAGSRVVDAVRAAGGLRADAEPDRVNLAAELSDGQRVVVPVVGQEIPAEVVPSGSPPASTQGGGPAKVDVNAAGAAELESLPGIGPATSAAIVAHRERHGPFRSVDSLLEVRGIGAAKLDALRDLVTAGGAG